MKLEASLENIMRSLRFIEQTDAPILDIASIESGIRLSIPGDLGSSEIAGTVEDDTPSHGSVTMGMLRLFHRAVSKWPGEINEDGLRPIFIELTGHRLTAFPLTHPMFLVSIPLRRALESSGNKEEWQERIVVNVSHSLDAIRDLIRLPSKRDPGEGITRIDIEPGILDMYSFDGHILAQHQTFVRTDGYLEVDVANTALRKALSSEFSELGPLDVKEGEAVLSLKRGDFEVAVGKAQSSIFEQALGFINGRNSRGMSWAKRIPLLRLCRTAEKIGAIHIEIIPHEGIARIADTSLMRRKGYRLPSEQEEKTGVTANAITLSSWTGEPTESFHIEAQDVIPPLSHLVDDNEVKITVLGDHGPEYLSIQGHEFFPRFGIRPKTRPGESNHGND